MGPSVLQLKIGSPVWIRTENCPGDKDYLWAFAARQNVYLSVKSTWASEPG